MSFGPSVFRPRAIPFPTIGCALIALFFVIQAIIVNSWMTVLSLAIALIFALAAAWYWYQVRQSSVLIDANQFIVKSGSKQRTFETDAIADIDLSSPTGQITFKDGTTTNLPLEGKQLVEAALLLMPNAPVND
ncbi:MAG: hypothetical protein ACRBK7_03115 [Acidimicrobiales bacterium]